MSTPYAQWFNRPDPAVQGMLTTKASVAICAILEAQERANIVGSVAEIGTFHGKTFIGLAKAIRPDERLLGIDVFEAQGKTFRDTFIKNIERHSADGDNVHVHTGPSSDVTTSDWQRFLKIPARFVHIDGGHGYRQVLYDTHLACSFLCDKAVIIFDDMFNEAFPDVTPAVIDALRANPQLRPVAIIGREGPLIQGGSKLICCSRNDQAIRLYDNLLKTRLDGEINARRTFLGEEIRTFAGC